MLRAREQLEGMFRDNLGLQLERLAQEHASALAAKTEALGAQQATALLAEQERAKGEKDAELERVRDQAGAMASPYQDGCGTGGHIYACHGGSRDMRSAHVTAEAADVTACAVRRGVTARAVRHGIC